MVNLALLTLPCYFVLNLIVTMTNKQLVSLTSCPYLLTALHSSCTFLTTNVLERLQLHASHSRQHRTSHTFTNLSLRTHAILVCFSLLYTVNIGISNLSLEHISLSLHQTIRATAPAITVLVCLTLLGQPLTSYSRSTYLSLIPTIAGVILATTTPRPRPDIQTASSPKTTLAGITVTFLGAVLAVLKTILTNMLQQRTGRLSVGIPSTTLIRYLAPYSVALALLLALCTGEFQRLRTIMFSMSTTTAIGGRISTITATNALGAALLNLASFEANRRCGPLAMAVAANLKQVLVLLFGWHADGDGWRVTAGAFMTIIGGVWYAFAQKQTNNRSVEGGKNRLDFVRSEGAGGSQPESPLISEV